MASRPQGIINSAIGTVTDTVIKAKSGTVYSFHVSVDGVTAGDHIALQDDRGTRVKILLPTGDANIPVQLPAVGLHFDGQIKYNQQLSGGAAVCTIGYE